jgi:hypothetical protein
VHVTDEYKVKENGCKIEKNREKRRKTANQFAILKDRLTDGLTRLTMGERSEM